MADDPIPPPSAATDPPLTNAPNHTSTGLPSNVAAALACFPLIGGIIFYVLEKRDSFVRFYAMQSIILGLGWLVFVIVWGVVHAILTPIPAVGGIFGFLLWVLWAVASIAILIVWLVAMFKAFTGVRWDIPYIGPMARKQVGEL